MTIKTPSRPTQSRSIAAGWVVVLAICLAVTLIPIIFMLTTSVKSQAEVFANPLSLPQNVQWDNFVRAWVEADLPSRAVNSLIILVASVLLSTITGAAAGYVCARIRPRWVGAAVTGLFALGLLLPVQSALVPLFTQMQSLGLLGTLVPIILVDAALQLPLTVVIFSSFFRVLPEEIEEAAFIDGANRVRVLASIVIPLSRPAIATSVILSSVAAWNDYFVALIFSTDPAIQPLTVGLATFSTQHSTDWPATLAYCTMIALPMFLLYVLLQRYITDGVATGAVRG